MEFGKIILVEMSNYTIYIDVENFIMLTGSLLLQGLLVIRLIFESPAEPLK